MPKAANYDAEKIDTFNKMIGGCIEYAQKHNLPMCVTEGAFRDVLTQIEAHRQVAALRNAGAKL